MLKKSTQTSTLDARRASASDTVEKCQKPRESTLAFIRQFARAYHFEHALVAQPVAAMVLN